MKGDPMSIARDKRLVTSTLSSDLKSWLWRNLNTSIDSVPYLVSFQVLRLEIIENLQFIRYRPVSSGMMYDINISIQALHYTITISEKLMIQTGLTDGIFQYEYLVPPVLTLCPVRQGCWKLSDGWGLTVGEGTCRSGVTLLDSSLQLILQTNLI